MDIKTEEMFNNDIFITDLHEIVKQKAVEKYEW